MAAIIAPTVADTERASAVFLRINEAWPGVRKVNADPPVYEVDSFLTDAECDRLVADGAPGLKRSIVVDGTAGKSAAPSRTSESCYLSKEKAAWFHDKIAALTRTDVKNHEPPQVARYTHDQFYLAHFDAFDVTTGPGRECVETGGQRICTVLVYLNSVASGGGTYFPKLDKRFIPTRGTALVFFPCTMDAKLDPWALHAAEKAGDEKWVSQVWIRQREFK